MRSEWSALYNSSVTPIGDVILFINTASISLSFSILYRQFDSYTPLFFFLSNTRYISLTMATPHIIVVISSSPEATPAPSPVLPPLPLPNYQRIEVVDLTGASPIHIGDVDLTGASPVRINLTEEDSLHDDIQPHEEGTPRNGDTPPPTLPGEEPVRLFTHPSIFPTSERYDYREEAIIAARNVAKEEGFILVTRASKRNHVYLTCDRGGTRRTNRSKGLRRSSTKKIDCNYAIKIECSSVIDDVESDEESDGIWRIVPQGGDSNYHNHEMDTGPFLAAHAMARRAAPEQLKLISSLHNSGAAPRVILRGVQEADPSALLGQRDIYNITSKMRRILLNGKSSIESLIDQLAKDDDLRKETFFYDATFDGDDNLRHLFFACEREMLLFKRNPEVSS